MKSINLSKVLTGIIVGCFLVACCSACASLKTFNTRPAGCEESVIYDYVPYPIVVSIIEADAVARIAANNPTLKPYLVKFCSDMLVLLNSGVSITYLDLANLACDQIKWANGYAGLTVMVASEILAPMNQALPIGSCDQAFLVTHFQRQLDALGGLQ